MNNNANDWDTDVVFKAFNDEKKIAYGYALVPNIKDKQEDIAKDDQVEKAAHNFMEVLSKNEQKGQGVGHEHETFTDIGFAVESVIDRDGSIAKSFNVPDVDIHPGGWWIGIKMTDKYWAMAKSGEITGFSIGGSAKRDPIPDLNKSGGDLADKLVNVLQKFFTTSSTNTYKRKKLEKSTPFNDLNKSVSYDKINTVQKIKEALIEKTWTLMDSFLSIIDDSDVSDKVFKVDESTSQFLADIKSLNKIENSLINKRDTGDDPMTQEEKDLMAKLEKKITELEAKIPVVPVEPVAKKEDDGVTVESILKGVSDNIQKIEKRLDGLETKPNVPLGVENHSTEPAPKNSEPVDIHKSIKSGSLANTALSFRIK